MDILCRLQTDDISRKLLQISEDGKYPSICHNADYNNLIFSLHDADTAFGNNLLYNLCLAYKGAALSSIIQLGKAVYQSDREDLKELYNKVRTLRSQKTLSSIRQPEDAGLLQEKLSEAENLLMREMLGLRGNYLCFGTWEDVRNSLSDNEMAVEFFDYTPIGKNLEYAPYQTYGALIIRKDMQEPVCLKLFSDSIFRGNTERFYLESNFILLWENILKPILAYAKKGDRIYYSPSGIINKIALENLADGGGLPAYSGYDFRRLMSTRELLSLSIFRLPEKVLLLGDINYDLSNEQLSVSDSTRAGFSPLPGSKAEISNISKILGNHRIAATMLTRQNASEDAFKMQIANGYDIIHIATHGFFMKDERQIQKNLFLSQLDTVAVRDNTLLRSGLILAGGNRAWQGKPLGVSNIDDGILTAQEIKDLDLSKTQMVVLSACETGLGEVNTDGVFGLQRAFKSAGVQTIVMSLWKVSDNATSLLMTEFYRNLLACKDRHKAFRMAKDAVRAKFPEAYYWAGWVMLD